MAGAALCFFIARILGRDVVEKICTKKALEQIDGFFDKYGKKSILVARLLPFISFDIVSYAAGLTSMLSKKDHKKVQFVLISGAVMLFLVFSSLIGVCMKAEMACHVTAAWCKGISVVILVCAVIDLITGKEGQLPV